MQLSLRSLEDLQSKYERAKKSAANIKEAARDAIMTVVQTAEVTTCAFSLGVINGYWSQPELLGIPVSGLVAAGFHTVGFILDEGSGAEHLHNLGDGAMAAWATTMGVGVGAKMAQEKAAAAAAPART
ncbi:MAG TPA: hypothetical protein VJN18_11060 [Polyangiaceae bacterium]|nr:hypothetical protein [Polyangiaceae bacterium]